MYLTYEEYKALGGTADFSANEFVNYESEARLVLDLLTFNRLRRLDPPDISENVKRCMIKLVEMAYSEFVVENSIGVQLVSESNDGVSMSYKAMTPDEKDIAIKSLIVRYLAHEKTSSGTPLLYCGVSDD